MKIASWIKRRSFGSPHGQYIMDKHHIILKGASGNGKTYLACALGHAACRKFRSVKYIRMPELLDELNVAKACGTFKKTIQSYQKVELLILDEWLIRALSPQESYDLLEIVESRCEKGSVIFCTQYERTSGTTGSIRIPMLKVQSLRQSWTGSSIIPMKF